MEENTFALNIPSTETILQQLSLQYEGPSEPGNDKASFGFSVPVITDHCPQKLQYLPFSKNSISISSEDKASLEVLDGKSLCIIICNSFDVYRNENDKASDSITSGTALCYIAGVWDATEDPLMGAVLYSCSCITVPAVDETQPPLPYLLQREQISAWLNEETSLEQKLEYFKRMI